MSYIITIVDTGKVMVMTPKEWELWFFDAPQHTLEVRLLNN